MKRVQVGDIEIKEASAVAAVRNRTEMDGVKTEAANAVLKVSTRNHSRGALRTLREKKKQGKSISRRGENNFPHKVLSIFASLLFSLSFAGVDSLSLSPLSSPSDCSEKIYCFLKSPSHRN